MLTVIASYNVRFPFSDPISAGRSSLYKQGFYVSMVFNKVVIFSCLIQLCSNWYISILLGFSDTIYGTLEVQKSASCVSLELNWHFHFPLKYIAFIKIIAVFLSIEWGANRSLILPFQKVKTLKILTVDDRCLSAIYFFPQCIFLSKNTGGKN